MEMDWGAVREEVTGYLQDLVRLDTTNPPGNETPAAEYLAGVLRREGIEPTVLESAPGRRNVVTRLKGTGEKGPLLLLSHLDIDQADSEVAARRETSCQAAEGQWEDERKAR